ncbi:hypothetical protein J4456_03030 [Candidatus Pacearchaeota archaeon]|nr:hypothetical protein [Candidatus Pacearchaeota archaeon]
MHIEVDQSGKIEQLDRDTVIAFSNDYQYSIFIPRKVKQEFYRLYRVRIKHLRYKLFVIGIYYCLRDYFRLNELILIDCEYSGKENLIKSLLLNLFRKYHLINPKIIHFGTIGKRSNAHAAAIDVFRENRKPNFTLSLKDIENLL